MKTVTFTDIEIDDFIHEKKILPEEPLIKLKPKSGHKEQQVEFESESGHSFLLILRESMFNQMDFSAILGFQIPQTNRIFRLRRYNGKSHIHSNPLEGKESFYDYHIHEATERYQENGYREEHFAMPSDRYSTLQQAVECLYADCNILFNRERKGGIQTTLRI
jgi:hypothetical protein